jgi:hypothetical protein
MGRAAGQTVRSPTVDSRYYDAWGTLFGLQLGVGLAALPSGCVRGTMRATGRCVCGGCRPCCTGTMLIVARRRPGAVALAGGWLVADAGQQRLSGCLLLLLLMSSVACCMLHVCERELYTLLLCCCWLLGLQWEVWGGGSEPPAYVLRPATCRCPGGMWDVGCRRGVT